MIVKVLKTFKSLKIQSRSYLTIIIKKYVLILIIFIFTLISLQTIHHLTWIYLHILFYTNIQVLNIFNILKYYYIFTFSTFDLFDKELRIWSKYPFIFINKERIYPSMLLCDCIIIKLQYNSEYFGILIT